MEANSSAWAKREQIKWRILLVMNCPKIQAQISKMTGLSKKDVSIGIKDLVVEGSVICLTTGLREGKVYDLTEQGQRKRETICKEENIPYTYSHPNIDWDLYGKIECGPLKKAIIKVMNDFYTNPVNILDKVSSFHHVGRRLSLYLILKEFDKESIVEKKPKPMKKKKGRIYLLYRITEKGKAIRDVILKE